MCLSMDELFCKMYFYWADILVYINWYNSGSGGIGFIVRLLRKFKKQDYHILAPCFIRHRVACRTCAAVLAAHANILIILLLIF